MSSNTARAQRSTLAAVGCTPLLTTAYASETVQSGINEIIVEVPKSAGIFTLKLKTTIYEPAGDDPFPLIVLSHDKACGKAAFQARIRYSGQAVALIVHDYIVATPIRQGFAKSSGAYIGSGYSVEANGIVQTEDMVAMLGYMTAQPYVDCNRIVVMGQSHGGLTTLAFGTVIYPGVRGPVNLAGGLRNDTCVDWEDNLVRAFEAYGRQSRYPSLQLYDDNDSYWPKPMPGRMLAAYAGADEEGRLVDFGTSKNDSHGMFASHAGLGVWLPQVDALLRKLGSPAGPVQAVTPGSNAEASGADDPGSDTNKDPE